MQYSLRETGGQRAWKQLGLFHTSITCYFQPYNLIGKPKRKESGLKKILDRD